MFKILKKTTHPHQAKPANTSIRTMRKFILLGAMLTTTTMAHAGLGAGAGIFAPVVIPEVEFLPVVILAIHLSSAGNTAYPGFDPNTFQHYQFSFYNDTDKKIKINNLISNLLNPDIADQRCTPTQNEDGSCKIDPSVTTIGQTIITLSPHEMYNIITKLYSMICEKGVVPDSSGAKTPSFNAVDFPHAVYDHQTILGTGAGYGVPLATFDGEIIYAHFIDHKNGIDKHEQQIRLEPYPAENGGTFSKKPDGELCSAAKGICVMLGTYKSDSTAIQEDVEQLVIKITANK